MTPDQIKEMRKLTVMTRKLSGWHAKHLERFALIAFDNIRQVKIRYDLGSPEHADPGFIEYQLTRILPSKKIGKNSKEIDKRFEALTRWTRDIFWNDIVVLATENDGVLRTTKKKKKK